MAFPLKLFLAVEIPAMAVCKIINLEAKFLAQCIHKRPEPQFDRRNAHNAPTRM